MAVLNPLNPRGDLSKQERYKQFESELDVALSEENEIYNVSVSGGYGAGKSSLIKTFLNEKRKDSDHILVSLASFMTHKKPILEGQTGAGSGTSGPDKNEVEQLILKHIIYSVSPTKIPRSKFSRILAHNRNDFDNEIGRLLAIVLMGLLLFMPEAVIGTLGLDQLVFRFSKTFDYINVGFIGIILSFAKLAGIAAWVWLVFPLIASLFWGLSKYSFNLKLKFAGVEGAAEKASEPGKSFLNEHIDELLYFFEMNERKRLVIFEDLDRLRDPDIFVKLREVNLLLNKYEGIKAKVVFLYATGDDVFVNSDRVKFFDLIIPVIPFVDSSNSYDVFLNRFEKLGISGLSKEFLREVSYFVNDFRLLQNITGEFHYYIKQLDWDGEELNKLFAIIVYKNIYPKDFTLLQSGDGELYSVLDCLDNFAVDLLVKSSEEKIANYQIDLGEAKDTVLAELSDARKIFIASLFSYFNTSNLRLNNTNINFKQALEDDMFTHVYESNRILIQGNQAIPNDELAANYSLIQRCTSAVAKGQNKKGDYCDSYLTAEKSNEEQIIKIGICHRQNRFI